MILKSILLAASLVVSGASFAKQVATQGPGGAPGSAGEPYQGMSSIAPIGVRMDKALDVPEAAKGPAIDPAKGYRVEKLGRDLYMVTDNVYQAMVMVHAAGVIVVDAPPSLAAYIPKAIAEVTDKKVTHLVYSHSHADHIGAAKSLNSPVIIAHEETKRLLDRAKDPNRPSPTSTFADRSTLKVGGQVLELSYHGNGHEPGNIFIYAPEQKVLMVVDVIFPGWMPWRRLALAQDVPGYFAQVEKIKSIDFQFLVSGHVARVGTKADVKVQSEFLDDLKAAAGQALKTTEPGKFLNPQDAGNPWAYYDNYIDRVAVQCVNTLSGKWANRLAAFDVFIWDLLRDGAEPAHRLMRRPGKPCPT